MSPEAVTLLTLACVVALFVWNRLLVELVAVGAALSLYATGVLTLPRCVLHTWAGGHADQDRLPSCGGDLCVLGGFVLLSASTSGRAGQVVAQLWRPVSVEQAQIAADAYGHTAA